MVHTVKRSKFPSTKCNAFQRFIDYASRVETEIFFFRNHHCQFLLTSDTNDCQGTC